MHTAIRFSTAWLAAILTLSALAALSTGCKGDPETNPPEITGITPNRGPIAGGTTVTITGKYFEGGVLVSIGGNDCTNIAIVSDTQLTCVTPVGNEGLQNVTVSSPAGGGNTLAAGFRYGPSVDAISPAVGPSAGGQAVTITGTGFNTVGTTVVTLGGGNATNVTVVSSTTITCTTQAHTAAVVDVVVTNPSGVQGQLENGYEFTDATTITGVNPPGGPLAGGNAVTIAGFSFTGATAVTFGGVAATNITIVNDTTITCTAPAGTGNVTVSVTSPTGTANLANAYSYNAAPTVANIAPAVGETAGGTAVTITGTGFLAGATVSIGGIAAAGVTVVSATTITATTGARTAGIVDVVVTNPDTQTGTLGSGFEYAPPPQILSSCPMEGDMRVSPYLKFVTITFDQPLDPGTVISANFTMTGFSPTVSLNGNTVTVTFGAPLAANTAYSITISSAVTSSLGIALDGDADGTAGDEGTLSFTTGTAGTVFGKTLTDLGQADGNPANFGSTETNGTIEPVAFFHNFAPLSAEIIFGQEAKIPAVLTPTAIDFNDTNPDTITVSGVDLTQSFSLGSLVVVSGSASNDGTYRVQGVFPSQLVLDPNDSLTTEFGNPGITLDGTTGNPQLMRQTWMAGSGLGTAVKLDPGATDDILDISAIVAPSGATACVLRRTDEGGTEALHAFVHTAMGWTNAATAQIYTGHPGIGMGMGEPQLGMRGDTPVIFWLSATGDAMLSEFVAGAWVNTAVYTNPGAAPAVFTGGGIFSADHGLVAYAVAGGLPNTIDFFAVSYNAVLRPGAPLGTPQMLIDDDFPANLPGGDIGLGVFGDKDGNAVFLTVLGSANDTVKFSRYDSTADTFTTVADAYVSNAGAGGTPIFNMQSGQQFGGGGGGNNPVARPILIDSIDNVWLIVQDDDATKSVHGVQYDEATDSWDNGRDFVVAGPTGAVRLTHVVQEISRDVHLFLLQEATAGGPDAEIHRFYFNATSDAWNAQADRADAIVPTIPQPGGLDDRQRFAFDNVWGAGSGDGFILTQENIGGGELREYLTRYTDSNQTFGTPALLDTTGAGFEEWDGFLVVDVVGDAMAFWRHDTGAGQNSRWAKFLGCDGGLKPAGTVKADVFRMNYFVDRRVTPAGVPNGTWSVIVITRQNGTGLGTRMTVQIITD